MVRELLLARGGGEGSDLRIPQLWIGEPKGHYSCLVLFFVIKLSRTEVDVPNWGLRSQGPIRKSDIKSYTGHPHSDLSP